MIYEPAEDSFLLARALVPYVRRKSVLDMCAGSGILARAALDAGALSVLAVDIHKDSVAHMKRSGIPAMQSDLFEKVKGKFDIILCNPPYLPEDTREDKESSRATTGGVKGDEFVLRFLRQALKFLAKDGKILLLLSSLTPQKKILAVLRQKKYTKRVIAEEKLFMEILHVWSISKQKSQ